jgi:hypothetical protein
MKRIKSTVTYKVPHWNSCNVDRFDIDGTPSKQLCQFCIKERGGYRCALYDEMLSATGNEVVKTRQCCKATAGFPSVIEPAQPAAAPTIQPKDLMKQTIDLYSKTVNDLITQGYPRPMAEMAAKKFILESN